MLQIQSMVGVTGASVAHCCSRYLCASCASDRVSTSPSTEVVPADFVSLGGCLERAPLSGGLLVPQKTPRNFHKLRFKLRSKLAEWHAKTRARRGSVFLSDGCDPRFVKVPEGRLEPRRRRRGAAARLMLWVLPSGVCERAAGFRRWSSSEEKGGGWGETT